MKSLIRKNWDSIMYLLFGALTTIVNFCVHFPLYNYMHLPAAVCSAIAWTVAVVFAFITNKPLVFKSNDWSVKTVVPELLKFTGCRMLSGAVETATLFITVDLLLWNGNIWKLITSVFVVVVNYIGSKFFVFKNK